MKRIEFGNIIIGETAKKHVKDCLDNNWISMGPKVAEFEKQWQELFDYKHARAVASGTAAGMACCMALYDFGANPGDEIIVPALSFIATANAVRAAGFVPKFVDVKIDSMNIDEEQIEQAINARTVAIKIVNLMGRPAELDKIQAIAIKHSLKVIVDNCEGYGSQFKGKYSLNYADMETSSHYTAHLICCAEGGMVSTNNAHIDECIESVRSHGRVGGKLYFDHVRFGLNLKMSDIHAAIGLGEIENFWQIFNKRRTNIRYLRKSLDGLEDKAWFTEEEPNNVNCPHGFSITLKPQYKEHIALFQEFLDSCSIHWKRNFGSMPHHKAFSYLKRNDEFPNAKYIGDFGIHVGCHYYLSDIDLEYLSDKLKEFLQKLN